ncbi:MAG: hypothetical protein JL50_16600 [Peptococcaceae bacterium BICA1-7]|nr:MAG: hypothetical protein JL50_16600 [Peptococcaceae bacterium BICA1-7]HBV96587.1 class I SAM-dependent methyltransferase [Desulfotomaculum sp.]
MSYGVKVNKYGFYELKNKPTPEELKKYYSEKYYQEAEGSYQINYAEDEIIYIKNKIEQRYAIINELLPGEIVKRRFLDIGCGEGWALKYFSERCWDVTGLDYSEYGCRAQNPDMLQYMIIGDINECLDKLTGQENFNIIWLDNVLEHVLSPLDLLIKCKKLVNKDGVLVIDVPNDFSPIQQHLLDNGYITKSFWVAVPDHISYFNSEGLISICDESGWTCSYVMGDFPIDIFLLNENTNYVEDKSKGKNCHKARVSIENLLHSISPSKTNELYRVLAQLGLGRGITAFFKSREEL